MFRIRVKVTCWSSSFESPTFENFKKQPETNWDRCIPLPVLAPPTCSSTPATGPQVLLYNIRDIPRSVAWKTISVGEEMNSTASYQLSWRELSSVFSTANLGKLLRQRQETMAGWDLDPSLPDCSRDSGPLNHLPVLVCCRCSFEIKDVFFFFFSGLCWCLLFTICSPVAVLPSPPSCPSRFSVPWPVLPGFSPLVLPVALALPALPLH